MTGQDVNIAALEFLAEDLHAGFVHGGLDGRGQLALQLLKLADLPAKGIPGDPFFADSAPVHDGCHAIPGSLGIGKAASQPPARLAKF